MINSVWLFLIISGIAVAAARGSMGDVSAGIMAGSSSSVELFLGLMGIMALWTGVMRVAERSGLVETLSRVIRPVLVPIFPEVPKNHPAMGAVVMNLAANMLALQCGHSHSINAMKELQKLNPKTFQGHQCHVTFLVLNTSSVQVIPATINRS